MLLNFDGAPGKTPSEQLTALGGVKDQVEKEMQPQWEQAYFWARFTQRLDVALSLHLHARKKVMAYTRAGNEHASVG